MFNEIVTLDLKDFLNKYALWMVDSFTRFIQGKLISNKKEDTIISALTATWCMNLGFLTNGFFADNRGFFDNIKLNKMTSKLVLKVKFGPAFSRWSNGNNKRNHDSADITIRYQILLLRQQLGPITHR